ncbi:MAG TPA: trehalose-phosphatase [Phycisphaerae bacterium]|nr:trehalose-phosphatase [Phycisphaerae bacterium]
MTLPDLDAALRDLAREPILLVAADFDGTLAPIVSDPADARAHAESLAALNALAALPNTHVAIISGRALADLAPRVAAVQHALLVGSHGAELPPHLASPPDPALAAALDPILRLVREAAANLPGALVETKPTAVAFHYRNADPAAAADSVTALLDAARHHPTIHTRHGKMVLEFSTTRADKGAALTALRNATHASAALFLGDDLTDEDAFRTLPPPNLPLKIGPGPTTAPHRLPDTLSIPPLLQTLTKLRNASPF